MWTARGTNETKMVCFCNVFFVCISLLSGGDQGLLNSFFSKWPVENISKHLPFIFNLSGTNIYSYLPAFQQWVSPLFSVLSYVKHTVSDWYIFLLEEVFFIILQMKHIKTYSNIFWSLCSQISMNFFFIAETLNFWVKGSNFLCLFVIYIFCLFWYISWVQYGHHK